MKLSTSPDESMSKLDVENLIQFAIRTQKEPLNENQKEQLSSLFKDDKSLNELALMLNDFIQIKNNYAARAGLSNSQFDRLKDLVEERQYLRELRETDKYNIAINQSIIANAKKSLPLEHILEWWTSAVDKLNSAEMWESFHKAAASEINNLKNEWETYSDYAGYSSANLLEFYREYIVVTEERLVCELKSRHKLPVIICRYLENIISRLQKLKKQVIYSMLYRLRCAEYYNDMACDDLLAYTCDRIEQNTQIKLNKKGKIPRRRRSLTLQILPEFIQCIDKFCRDNPHEKTMRALFMQLRVQNRPLELNSSEETPSHPALNYFAGTYPPLLEQTPEYTQLTKQILCSGAMKDKSFILNILKNNLKYAFSACGDMNVKNHRLADFLNEQQRKYTHILKEINAKITIDIETTMDLILDNLFNGTLIDGALADEAAGKIEKSRLFNKKYLNEDCFHPGDIILALAERIKEMMAQQRELTPRHCGDIFNLLMKLHPEIIGDRGKKLRGALDNLPKELGALHHAKQSEVLHFIIHYIEAPTLSEDSLAAALSRHRAIAGIYQEKWIASIDYPDHSFPPGEKLNIIALYIKNVLLNIIRISPSIDLDNFDNNGLCLLLANIEKRHSISTHHLYFIKNDLERNILEKLNDSFLLKKYLFQENKDRVDLNKLLLLLDRIDHFFTGKENKAILVQSITQACYSIIKSYCIHVIEKDTVPDSAYIKELLSILGITALEKLRRDNEMREVLKQYINTYHGHSNHLSVFLIHLFPFNEPYIYRYAEERLNYIKSSRAAAEDDYAFFFYFCSDTKIAALFNGYKVFMQKMIQGLLNATSSPWERNLASLVELFCDKDAIITYRQKRILELLDLAKKNIGDNDGGKLFSEFLSTINQSRFIHKHSKTHAILPKTPLTLRNKIKDLIMNSPWSLLLENIVIACGSRQQRRQLHYQLLHHHLILSLPFTGKWLDKQINDQNDASRKDFFLDFFGEKNIKNICEILDILAQKLIRANDRICPQTPSPTDHKQLTQLIECIRPLALFYQLHGNKKSTSELFLNLAEIEKNITLHFKLSSMISQNTSLSKIEGCNLKLHNLMFSIMQSIHTFSDGYKTEEQNINDDLSCLNNVILSDMERFILDNKTRLNFPTLSAITNLLFQLASNDLKKLLLTANKPQFEQNPYWLCLINHLNDGHAINEIEYSFKTLHDQQIDYAFYQVFSFAKRLSHIKGLSHQLLKKNLLAEAGIVLPENESVNISTLMKTKTIKNASLIKLWSTCVQKLQKDHLPMETQSRYLHFIIRFLTRISDEILSQAKDNPTLLNRFIDLFRLVPDVQLDIQSSLSAYARHSRKLNIGSLWCEISESDKLLGLLLTILNKAFALQLMQKIEKYFLKKISESKLAHFKSICNDPRFGAIAGNVLLDLEEIEITFNTKRKVDALKMACLMKIYARLSRLQQKGGETSSILALLDNTMQEMKDNPSLRASRHYPALLQELLELAEKYFTPGNKRNFLRESGKATSLTCHASESWHPGL